MTRSVRASNGEQFTAPSRFGIPLNPPSKGDLRGSLRKTSVVYDLAPFSVWPMGDLRGGAPKRSGWIRVRPCSPIAAGPKNAGFSPIEVLIAMAILAIGIMAVVKLFPSGLQFSRIAQERTVAAELADANLGRMRMTGAGNLLGVARAGDIYNSSAGVELGTEGRVPREGLLDGYATVVQRSGGVLESKLVRVVFTVDLADGRRENFVTYVTDY